MDRHERRSSVPPEILAIQILHDFSEYLKDDPFFENFERLNGVTNEAAAMIESLRMSGMLETCRESCSYIDDVCVVQEILLDIKSTKQDHLDLQNTLPDIDDPRGSIILKARRNKNIAALSGPGAERKTPLHRYSYTFDGNCTSIREISLGDFSEGFDNLSTSEIEIFHLVVPLMLFSNFREYSMLSDSLALSPSFNIRMRRLTPNGLARRFLPQERPSGQSSPNRDEEGVLPQVIKARYQIWFSLPLVDFSKDASDAEPFNKEVNDTLYRVGLSSTAASGLNISLCEDHAAFHLEYDCCSGRTTIFASKSVIQRGRISNLCSQSENLDLRSDPFAFLTCALSTIIHDWGASSEGHFAQLNYIEQWILNLNEDITVKEIQQAKNYIFELKKLHPFNNRLLLAWDCLFKVAQDAVHEHEAVVKLFDIPHLTSLRVDRNLRTIVAWADSILADTKLRLQRLDSALSTLSDIFSMRNDMSLKINTETLVRVAEGAQQENYIMQEIAQSTRLDSQAMKTIATLTMLYLPATFVATFFSMGLIRFQPSEEGGGIEVSRSWWIYFTITIPMTFGTYIIFQIIRQRSENSKRRGINAVMPAAKLVEDKSAK